MKRGIIALAAILAVVGVNGLVRFSHDVRTVDAVGLSGSGFSLGVGFAFLVMGLSGKLKQ